MIGGVDDESGRKAFDLYHRFIPNLSLVSSSRVAEFAKVVEGCYRDVNIALANELYKAADMLGIDFFEARLHANHEFCHIHLPSVGVGGHCIPVYPWFLVDACAWRPDSTSLIGFSRHLNDSMVEFWFTKILYACSQLSKPLKHVKVCLDGITYREGVKGIYHSRSLALAGVLRERGFNVFLYDRLYTPEDITDFGFPFLEPSDADVVFHTHTLTLVVNR